MMSLLQKIAPYNISEMVNHHFKPFKNIIDILTRKVKLQKQKIGIILDIINNSLDHLLFNASIFILSFNREIDELL